eukprot:gene33144-37447_t
MGVRVEMPSNQPIVLLREITGERYLPIWIGAVEATAIAFAQQGVIPPRPLTHDLLKDVLEATGNELTEVRITDVKDGVFFATLVFESGAEVSARPSDSIALALRTGTKILCAEEVLDEAGLAVPAEQEDEVEKFREFLDQVEGCDTPLESLTAPVIGRTLKCLCCNSTLVLPRSYVQRSRPTEDRVNEQKPETGVSAAAVEAVETAEEQGLLFTDDVSPLPSDLGYRGPTACNAAGITYRQLDYWARPGLIAPTVRG